MELIKGKLNRAKKVVIYGPEGIGKSTFASHFPMPVFIDTEGSTGELDVTRFPAPSSWQYLIGCVDYVIKNPYDFKTLVIDTADWTEKMCEKYVCDNAEHTGIEDFGYGKGYTYLREEFGRFLNKLEEVINAGINVVITAHAMLVKIENPEEQGSYDHWSLKLSKQCSPLLKEWADMVLFSNYKIETYTDSKTKKTKASGGARKMFTNHTPYYDAKNRYGLPDICDFDYSSIKHIIEGSTEHANNVAEINPEPVKAEPKKDNPSKKQEEKLNQIIDDEKPQQDIPTDLNKVYADMGVKKSLADLMIRDNISPSLIMYVVTQNGFYPFNTPIKNYDDDFIDGALVGQWSQFVEVCKKAEAELPFKD